MLRVIEYFAVTQSHSKIPIMTCVNPQQYSIVTMSPSRTISEIPQYHNRASCQSETLQLYRKKDSYVASVAVVCEAVVKRTSRTTPTTVNYTALVPPLTPLSTLNWRAPAITPWRHLSPCMKIYHDSVEAVLVALSLTHRWQMQELYAMMLFIPTCQRQLNFLFSLCIVCCLCHIPLLESLLLLKINERINYKLLSPTHKVLTTTEPSYLQAYKLISVQPPRNTRSSSSVTIYRPSSSSSLKITNRSFRFASPHLWNQLPVSSRQSTNQSPSHSPHFTHGSSCTSSSFLPSLTPLFHSRLKTYHFTSFQPQTSGTLLLNCLLGLILLF